MDSKPIHYPVTVREYLHDETKRPFWMIVDSSSTDTKDVEVAVIYRDKDTAVALANALNAMHELEGKSMSYLWSYSITYWWKKYVDRKE